MDASAILLYNVQIMFVAAINVCVLKRTPSRILVTSDSLCTHRYAQAFSVLKMESSFSGIAREYR